MAREALDRSDHRYRVAYTSEHCAGQEAAMQADLAIGPFPLSLIQPPLQQLGDEYQLPELGDYQIAMLYRGEEGSAILPHKHRLGVRVQQIGRTVRCAAAKAPALLRCLPPSSGLTADVSGSRSRAPAPSGQKGNGARHDRSGD